jgi:tetratricopeptide (TPR) repeat protein
MSRLLKHIFLSFLVMAMLFNAAHAQTEKKEQLAQQFLENKEYDKAAQLYLELYEVIPSFQYYNQYIFCLNELSDFKNAEKFIKKQIKRFPQQLSYKVDLARVYQQTGEKEKALKEMEEALQQLKPDQSQVVNLAQSFIKAKEYDYALKTYQKGRKLLNNIYPFYFELADVYGMKDDFAGMINEYLEAVAYNEAYMMQVQNILQSAVGEDPKSKRNEELRKQLLRRIQTNQETMAYSEMLIWFMIQQKDFESALTQSKALDKRLKGQSGKVITLANICLSNQDYDIAIKCYEYEISKGATNPYYLHSRMELVSVLKKKITESGLYNSADILQLETAYLEAIKELGKSSRTTPLLRGYAHLLAFYLNQPDKAIQVLEEVLNFPGTDPRQLAECKLELGDILLFTGEMWECSLLYSQVEKAYKEDAIGQEAKFRNARLSYFKGEFEWAQAQLDVLKAATSKLIANDALELSLLILDNSPDSVYEPLQMFARAELLAYQNLDSLSMLSLDSILSFHQGHALTDDVHFRKYKLAIKKQKYNEAAEHLRKIITFHSEDILGDDATFKLAELYDQKLNNQEKAMELYQDVLVKYPGSLYVVEARKRFRKMRGDQIN